jgi:predicted GNAT family acetyltransferase
MEYLMQKIQHVFDGQRGSFYIEENNQKVATMDYVMASDSKLIIEHTGVDESLRGQGIGKKLLEKLVEHTRDKQIKVLSFCSFANAVFKKTPEWQDVLK